MFIVVITFYFDPKGIQMFHFILPYLCYYRNKVVYRYMKLHLYAVFGLMSVFASLSACSFSMVATLRSDKQVDLSYTGAIKPKVAALFSNLSGSVKSSGGPLVSAASVTTSLQTIPELSQIVTKDLNPQGLEGRLRIANPEKLSQRFPFISQQWEADSSLFSLTLSRETAPQLLSLISAEVRDYLEALMAPIVTGEELSTADYLALIASVYGKTIAQEIESSSISLEIRIPGTITTVLGGTSLETKAIFKIPLVDLLVLQKPLVYRIGWK